MGLIIFADYAEMLQHEEYPDFITLVFRLLFKRTTVNAGSAQ
jgi:hypothetical protein